MQLTKNRDAHEIGDPPAHRDSNLELFRIITMVLIVAHHYVVNSGLTDLIYEVPLSRTSLFLSLFGAWGKVGINCFVLITGYFMCQSHITGKKFLKLLLEIEFYKILFYLVFLISGYETFSVLGLIKAIFPITSISTGFVSCYLVFFLFIPFLNILIHHMDEKQHIKLILLCSFIYVLLGTIPDFDLNMNYVSWFCVLYFIASYLRLYPKRIFDNTKLWGFLALASVLISAASVLGCAWFGTIINQRNMLFFLADSNKILAVITSICAFLFFKNIKLQYSRFINTVAASTFGVLLIHANSDTMRQWLWRDTLKNTSMFESPWLILHAFGSVLAVYLICTGIDWLRIKFIEHPFFVFRERKQARFIAKYKQIEHNIFTKMHVEKE